MDWPHTPQVKLQRHVTLYWNTHPIWHLDKYKIAHASCHFMFPQHKCYTSNSPKCARAGLRHKFERFIYLFYRIKSPRDYPKSTWISWVEKLKWVLCISKQTCTNTLAVSTPMALHQRRDQSDFTSGVEYMPRLKESSFKQFSDSRNYTTCTLCCKHPIWAKTGF